MSTFPKAGDVAETRAWLDSKGFHEIFVGWEADAILGKDDGFVKSRFPKDVQGQEAGEMLSGLLTTARRTSHTAPETMSVSFAKNVIYVDTRVRMFGETIRGSDVSRSKTGDSNQFYWSRCLFCGKQAQSSLKISETHIINGVKGHDYSAFGKASGYKSDLDVRSTRNYIPLCGTLGVKSTCHHEMDQFHVALLWNPFQQHFCLYSAHEDSKHLHEKILPTYTFPESCLPYRRFLAARGYRVGLTCLNDKLLALPNLIVPQDTQSTAEDRQSEESGDAGSKELSYKGGGASSHSEASATPSGLLGKRENSESFEERRQKRFGAPSSRDSGMV